MSVKKKSSPESIVQDSKRITRRKFTTEEKIRIGLEGLRGEQSIARNSSPSGRMLIRVSLRWRMPGRGWLD